LRDSLQTRDEGGRVRVARAAAHAAAAGLVVKLRGEDNRTERPADPRTKETHLMGHIVGLTGRANSGKDTVGDRLVDREYARRAFAEPIKKFCCDVFGIEPAYCWGPSPYRNEVVRTEFRSDELHRWLKAFHDRSLLPSQWAAALAFFHDVHARHLSGPTTVRRILQVVGTEWGRALYPDLWVNALFVTLTERSVITDVRFENEVAAIHDFGGKIWFVDAEQRLGPRTDAHASEPSAEVMRGWADVVIDNNGPLEALVVP
jgi:hypothetical protein